MGAIDPRRTALVAIDLQHGILSMKTLPTQSRQVVQRTAELSRSLASAGSSIIYVTVSNSADGGDILTPIVDNPTAASSRPARWSELDPLLPVERNTILITKRQWGAFYGTELDLQLRRRQIETIVLTGISTNVGVESTAREAFERGYNQIFVKDAIASPSLEAHALAFNTTFPRLGRIRCSKQVLRMIDYGC